MKRTNTAVWLEKQQRWQLKVQKDGVRKTFTCAEKGRTGQRKCNAKADAWLDKGIVNTSARMEQLWVPFMESVSESTSAANQKNIQNIGENYILPCIGRIKVQDLSVGKLQDIINKAYKSGTQKKNAVRRSDEPLSRKTLQNIRHCMLSFIKWCRINNYTSLFPDEQITIPKGARASEKAILQPDALRILFAVDTCTRYGKPVYDECIHTYRFAVLTGMRMGEILGLQCGDIEGNRVHIRRAINSAGITTKGKNENALRTFTLTDAAAAELAAQIEWLKDHKLSHGKTAKVFPWETQATLYHRWERYQKANGINHISFYELRHTFVSVAAGALNPAQLKALVGHSKSMDTLGVYAHTLEGTEQATADALQNTMDAILNQ